MSRIVVCVERVKEDKRSCALAEERTEEERVRRARKKLAWIYARRGHGRGDDRQKPRWRGQRRRRVNRDVNR